MSDSHGVIWVSRLESKQGVQLDARVYENQLPLNKRFRGLNRMDEAKKVFSKNCAKIGNSIYLEIKLYSNLRLVKSFKRINCVSILPDLKSQQIFWIPALSI